MPYWLNIIAGIYHTESVVSLIRKIKGIHDKDGMEFDGISTLMPWMEKLESSKASDELTEDEARQLIFDLEKSYGAFHSFLGS